MVAVTLLRGFRVSVSTLDAFVHANGVDETYGWPPLDPATDATTVLLHSKLGSEADPQRMARVVIPRRKAKNKSTVAYVAYAWVMAYAHREIDPDTELPTHPPSAFEALRKEILAFGNKRALRHAPLKTFEGKFGLFLVQTEEVGFQPEELRARHKVPQKCDQCDETFDNPDAWKRWQDHRREVHGSPEGYDPLPEA